MLRRTSTVLLLVTLLTFLLALPAQSRSLPGNPTPDKIHSALRARLAGTSPGSPQHFLVLLDQQTAITSATKRLAPRERRHAVVSALKETAAATQQPVLATLKALQQEGHVTSFDALWVVNGFTVTGDQTAVDRLAAHTAVRLLTANEQVPLSDSTPTVEPTLQATTTAALPWDLEMIKAPQAWARGADGTGVVVGSIDTGVDANHPALKNSFQGNDPNGPGLAASWLDLVGFRALPYDDIGHGTHTTGTMVGRDPATGQTTGVAPGAKWIAVKAFTNQGAYDSDLLKAGQWMLAPTDASGTPHPEWAPDVINNSWGGAATSSDGRDEFYRTMVNNWLAAGIFPVFANGNSGPGPSTVEVPANYPESYAVGAVDAYQHIASFSSRGPGPYPGTVKPDIVAPGVSILSTLPGGQYGTMSGTSMATPHVAGVVALMRSALPSVSVDTIRSLLNQTAVPLTDSAYPTSPNAAYGRGLLDADAAVASLVARGTLTVQATDAATNQSLAADLYLTPGGLQATAGQAVELVPGTYTLTTSSYGYLADTRSVTVNDGESVTVSVALQAQTPGSVTGTVTDAATGAPLAGAAVYAAEDLRLPPVLTGTDGRFTLTPFPGTYSLRIKATGYGLRAVMATVAESLDLGTIALTEAAPRPDDWPSTWGEPDHGGNLASPVAPPLARHWVNASFVSDGTRPIVVGGRVFAMGTVNGTAALVAIDAATGVQLWQQPVLTYGSGPVAADGVVFVASRDNAVHAYEAATGNPIWSAPTGGRLNRQPTVAGGQLYVVTSTTQGIRLNAYQAETGKLAWTAPLAGGESSPAVSDGTVYVSGGGPKTYAFDAATGGQIWYRDGCNGCSRSGGQIPVIAGDILLEWVGSTNVLNALDRATGQLRWTYQGAAGVPVATADFIAVSRSAGGVAILDPATGQELWQTAAVSGSLIRTGDYLYGDGLAGIRLSDRTPFSPQLAGHNPPGTGNGLLVAADETGHLNAFDTADLYGRVHLQGGLAPLGTNITVANGANSYTGAVAADGSFALGGLPPGTYRLTVARSLYRSASLSVTVTTGLPLDVGDLILPAGDVDGDGVIDLTDLQALASFYGLPGASGDYNGDMRTDLLDLWQAAWNVGAP